jgi:hypothetical protein
MPRRISALQYTDVISLLDALEHFGSLRYPCPTENMAIKLQQRCNTWRAHLREQENFRFDIYLFRREGNILVFEKRPTLTGYAYTSDGQQIDLNAPLPEKQRPWTREEIEAAMHAPDLEKFVDNMKK